MDKKSRNLTLAGLALIVVLLVLFSVLRGQRDQSLLVRMRGPGLLRVDEIRDWQGLVKKLADVDVAGKPSPTRRIAEVLAGDVKQILSDAKKSGSIPTEKRPDVVRGLVEVQRNRGLYQVADFQGVALPAEAKELLARADLMDRESEWLNRYVLEAVFPTEIAKADAPSPDQRVAAAKSLLESGRLVDLVLAQPADIEERQKQFGAREVLWSDASARKDAVDALAGVGLRYPELKDKAIDALVGLMKGVDREQQDVIAKVRDEETAQRQMCWKILRRYGDAPIDRLIAALKDPSGGVRDQAVDGLGVLGYPAAVKVLPWVKVKDTRGKAVEVLFRANRAAVDLVIPMIDDRDEEIRAAIAELLGRLDDTRAVPALLAHLNDTAPNIRRNVIRSLGQITDSRATLEIARVMREDPQVRMEAITALGEIGDPRGVDPLVDLFKGYDLEVPTAAIAALTKIGPSSLPRLLREAKNPDPEIRLYATRGLASLSGPTVVAPLLAAAKDSDPKIREAAVAGMSKFLEGDALRVIPTLVAGFSDPSAGVSTSSVAGLKELGTSGAPEVKKAVVGPLVALLGRSDQPAAQFYANRALSQIGGSDVVSALVSELKSPSLSMQKWAALTLGDVEQKEDSQKATPMLKQLASDPRPEVRWAAEEALRKMGRRIQGESPKDVS
ncbi:MAG TPA: HEAT repeat domain-containing protein [Armatimonadota bacterium]|jgi:HEAT repeat protein